MCMWVYVAMYVYVCVNICMYSFKENLKSKRVLDFSTLLLVSILTSSSQYTVYTIQYTLKLHLYVKF